MLKGGLYLAGAVAVGVVAGMLTAPKSGKETREDLEKEIDRLKSKLADAASTSRDAIKDEISNLKNSITNPDKNSKKEMETNLNSKH